MLSPPVYWSRWEELKAKYNFTCPCCGRTEPEIKLTKDHIIPIALGGAKGYKNLQPLCAECNQIKSGNHTTAYPIKQIGEVILLPISRSAIRKYRKIKRLGLRMRIRQRHRRQAKKKQITPIGKITKRINWGYWQGEIVAFEPRPNQPMLNKLADMGLILQMYREPDPLTNDERQEFMLTSAYPPTSNPIDNHNSIIKDRFQEVSNLIDELEKQLRPILVDSPVDASSHMAQGSPTRPTEPTPVLRDLEDIRSHLVGILDRIGI